MPLLTATSKEQSLRGLCRCGPRKLRDLAADCAAVSRDKPQPRSGESENFPVMQLGSRALCNMFRLCFSEAQRTAQSQHAQLANRTGRPGGASHLVNLHSTVSVDPTYLSNLRLHGPSQHDGLAGNFQDGVVHSQAYRDFDRRAAATGCANGADLHRALGFSVPCCRSCAACAGRTACLVPSCYKWVEHNSSPCCASRSGRFGRERHPHVPGRGRAVAQLSTGGACHAAGLCTPPIAGVGVLQLAARGCCCLPTQPRAPRACRARAPPGGRWPRRKLHSHHPECEAGEALCLVVQRAHKAASSKLALLRGSHDMCDICLLACHGLTSVCRATPCCRFCCQVDRLHKAAGSSHIIELHGRWAAGAGDGNARHCDWSACDPQAVAQGRWPAAAAAPPSPPPPPIPAHGSSSLNFPRRKLRPCSIWDVCRAGRGGRKASRCWEDRTQPLCPALAGRGAPDGDASPAADIPLGVLPHDAEGHLLRPGVV